MTALGLALSLCHAVAGGANSVAPRDVRLDIARAAGPVDRFFDFSVGADFCPPL
jgi:xylan 1,4-beta-xylosidase